MTTDRSAIRLKGFQHGAFRPVAKPATVYDGARGKQPAAIAGAIWQAGITPDNADFRVYIDGVPAPLCFAANPRLGWARVYVVNREGGIVRNDVDEPVSTLVKGKIELRRCFE